MLKVTLLLTVLSVWDWAIRSRVPLMVSSWVNSLSALFSTLLPPLKHLSACGTDDGNITTELGAAGYVVDFDNQSINQSVVT